MVGDVVWEFRVERDPVVRGRRTVVRGVSVFVGTLAMRRVDVRKCRLVSMMYLNEKLEKKIQYAKFMRYLRNEKRKDCHYTRKQEGERLVQLAAAYLHSSTTYIMMPSSGD